MVTYKIYFPGAKKCETLEVLLKALYSHNGYSVETYYDKEFESIQCRNGSRRSFEDLLAIANTYFNNVSEEELMENLIKIKIRFYYCFDIHKIVFHYNSNVLIDTNCFINCGCGSFVHNTYTPEMLEKILSKVDIKSLKLEVF